MARHNATRPPEAAKPFSLTAGTYLLRPGSGQGILGQKRSSPMADITAKYLGDLRVECVHQQSGTVLVTDAPKDNNGKGEAFCPTDLCATALAACAMTIIGIYGRNHGVDVTGTTIEISKTMSANPRRIGKIEIIFNMPDREFSEKEKTMIERAAHTCPVHLSLHPDTEQVFTFKWSR